MGSCALFFYGFYFLFAAKSGGWAFCFFCAVFFVRRVGWRRTKNKQAEACSTFWFSREWRST